MKKFLKTTVHVFSLASFALLMFSGSFVNKLTRQGPVQKEKQSSPEGLFSAFATTEAFADNPNPPPPPPPSDGDAPAGDGCGCDGCCGCSSGGDC